MNKPKLGKGLAALTGTAILATAQSAADDQTAAACRIEETRYERAMRRLCAASATGCGRSILKICASSSEAAE